MRILIRIKATCNNFSISAFESEILNEHINIIFIIINDKKKKIKISKTSPKNNTNIYKLFNNIS